jgi:tRNA (guanine37-N1)-methyltransferase
LLQFSIITLFPQAILPYLQASIVGRAQQAGVVSITCINPRDFSTDPHHKVDDSPYGGGAGMVLTCQPLLDAVRSLLPLPLNSRVLLTTPAGKQFNQVYAKALAQSASHIVILCGHYEGFDERLTTLLPHLTGIPLEKVSIGDMVLTGGELPAMCMVDAITRMCPGAVQKQASVEGDAFYDAIHPRLDFPHYTRPATVEGLAVPEVLLSGNHQAIETWRAKMALYHTWRDRPDLLLHQTMTQVEERWLDEFISDG